MVENLYQEIIKKLCEPFPDEVKIQRQDKRGTYIPIAIYIERLNEVAGQHWSHERIGEPLFYEEDQFVYTRVNVTICGRSHHGEGFSKYQVDKETRRIKNRHYAIRSATKDAIRDAISFFGMGSNNERYSSSKSIQPTTSNNDRTLRSCLKCSQILNQSEIASLDALNIKYDYCTEHTPKHLLKGN